MFGSKPAFGASNTSFGTGTSLFGQNKPATSLFGQPQQQQPQQATTLFGAKPAGTGLFGQPTTNNATTGTSLFGSTAANTSGGGGLFGQAKPSLFGASTANSSFGQTSTSLFGSTAGTATGANTGLFGSTAAAAVPTGSTVKFEPVIGQDTMQKNGTNSQISTKHMCITAMKAYESKCIEELRVEDYMAGRKAPAAGSTTTTGGLFGQSTAAPTTGGLFGSSTPQQKSLFGSTTTAAPTFGAPAGGTSIFGSPAPAATTGTSLFSKPPGTSLFGSTAAPAVGTSLFGSTTAAPAATTGLFGQPAPTSTFGQPAATGTSLFGAPAASAATSSFSFGAPATSQAGFGGTTSLFGAPAASAAGTSLFGAKPATTSAFSFGGGATTTTTASPFGAAFGAAPAGGLFGAPKPATTTFGAPGTSLFGAPAQQPSLFGQPAAQQQQMGAFGAPAAAQQHIVQQVAAAPIELVTNISQAQMEMALINAQLGASPYGDSPMFNVKESKKDTDDKPNPTSVQRQLKFLASKKDSNSSPLTSGSAAAAKSSLVSKVLDVSVGATPGGCRSPLTTKDLVYSPSVLPPTLGRGLRSGAPAMHNSSMLNHSRTERSMLKDSVDASIEASLRGNGANRLLAPQSARNLKHLDASALNSVYSLANRSGLGGSGGGAPAAARDPDELPRRADNGGSSGNVLSPLAAGPADGLLARNATLHARQPPTLNLDVTSETVEGSPVRSAAQQQKETTSSSAASPLVAAAVAAASGGQATTTTGAARSTERLSIGSAREVPGTGVRLLQPDYYTIPSIEAMRDMIRDGTVVLPDGITVGRHTFGTIFWPGRLELHDVTLDEIIVFRNKEVTVYPDESIKPQLGQGFNRPAEITLERVWPVDKHTKEEVKDAVALVNMNWREKLEKTTMRMDADFKDFRPLTGSWVFRVKHFSKYGLPDDESEEESADASSQSMKENLLHDRVQRAKVQLAAAGDAPIGATGAAAAALPQRTSLMGVVGASDDEVMIDEDAALLRRAQQGIAALAGRAAAAAAGLGGDASYLASPEAARGAAREGRVTLGLTDNSVIALDRGDDWRMSGDDWRVTAVPDKKIKMETIDQEAYEESHRLRTMVRQRVHPRGLKTGGALTLTKRDPARAFETHAPDARSLRAPAKTGLIDETAAHGACSRVGWAAGGLSVASLLPAHNGVAIRMRTFDHEYSQEYISDMFEHNQQLSAVITRHRSSSNRAKHCELEEEAPSAPRIKPTQHYAQLIHSFAATASQSGRAKECLVWELCGALFPADRPDAIWEWDRREAVGDWARKALASESASLKPISGRGAAVWKQLSKGELENAIDAAVDEGLNVLASLLAVFTLDPEETMHDFKRQVDDWQRSGMLAKMPVPLAKCYITMAGLTHIGQVNCLEGLPWQAALGLCGLWYSKRAESLDACVARVEREETDGRVSLPPLSVYLELMRVSVDRTRSIERVLDAAIGASSAPKDFHLAWHVWAVTRAVGLPSMDECAEHALHTQYAEQLTTAAALPHAALFVLAHIKNGQCRNLAMRELIDRCALTRQPLDHARAIEWCRVPAEWIEWAKYLEAKLEGDVHAQCERALRAGELALAHRLYVTEVAPDLLVTDQLELLDDLAQQFEEAVDRIPAWGIGGQLYTHYIELRQLQDSEEESLDELQRLRDEICYRLLLDDRCTPIQQMAMETMGREMSELGKVLRPDTISSVPLNAKSAPEIVEADLSMMMD